MTITMTRTPDITVRPAYEPRKLRKAAALTRKQLAVIAGVPFEHVALFERGLPLPLDSKRRILRELWAITSRK
jgi:transcriptional regulator with XRE-family HTH domain